MFPPVPYGITPYFGAYPGTVSLRVATYTALIRDILDSLQRSGFRRILLVNGHGGNQPAASLAVEWIADHPDCRVKFHNWWSAPRTMAKVKEIDPVASHASWMENFTWTRLPGVEQPAQQKPMVDFERMRMLDPQGVREVIGDGNFGGLYQRSDEEMQAIWEIAVVETRELLEGPWS